MNKTNRYFVIDKLVLTAIFFFASISILWASISNAEKNDAIYINDNSQYEYAEFLKTSGNYKKARREFSRLIVGYPDSRLVPKAHFSLAETLFLNKDHVKSYRAFKDFIKNYGKSSSSSNKEMVVKSRGYIAKIKSTLENKSTERSRRTREVISSSPSRGKSSGTVDRLKAVQVLVFEGKTMKELDRELSQLKSEGVNTVIVRVFNNLGDRYHPFVEPEAKVGVYFQTTSVPVVADILGHVIDRSHKKGLKVFAWMTTRYANYGIENKKDMACKGYDMETERLSDCKGLDMFHSGTIKHLESIYRDLARYDIDGVLFQDDLVLKHNEGFGESASRLFQIERGRQINAGSFYRKDSSGKVQYTPLFWEWVQWKNKKLIAIASRLKEVVQEENPDVKFAINLMYEAVTNPVYALAWLSQDLEKAVDAGFNYFAIMAYHRQMSNELGKSNEEIKKLIKEMVVKATDIVGNENKLLFKVQTVDWDTGDKIHYKEIRDVLDSIKSVGNVSLALVPHRMDLPVGTLQDMLSYNK